MKRVLTTLGLILTLAAQCAHDHMALRDNPADRVYRIDVLRVRDPRLPDLTDAQFTDMLERLRGHVREYLGYRVEFTLLPQIDILEFKKANRRLDGTAEMRELRADLLDIGSESDRARLRSFIDTLVEKTGEDILRSYVPSYRARPDRAAFAERLYADYVTRLASIQSIRTGDGTALAGGEYADTLTYPFWEMALRRLPKGHFVFTNTIMADAEVNIPIYVALRYGVTTGMVTGNASNAFRAAGVMFLYPFLSRDAFFARERKERIPDSLLTDVIALYSTHEMGHFLNHFRDYYDHPRCIMVPAADLNYLRWYRERKGARCPLPHEKLKQF